MIVRTELTDEALSTLGRLAAEAATAALNDTSTLAVATTATVEGYVDGVLRRLIDSSPYQTSAFLKMLVAEMEDRIFQSWSERFRWLRGGFGLMLEGSSEKKRLDVLIELRNACVHGNGSLTERQCRDVAALLALERQLGNVLGVTVVRRRLIFSSSTARRAVTVARDFVIAFDDELRRAQVGLI